MIVPRALGIPIAILVALMTAMVTYTAGIGAAPQAFFGDADILVIGPEGNALPGQAHVDLARVVPLRGLPGVEAVSPEVYSLIEIDGRSAFLRGVLFDDFVRLEQATLVDGRMPTGSREAVAGKGFLDRFDLEVPHRMVLPAGYLRTGADVTIVGAIDLDGAARDELLVPLDLAAEMMDLPPGRAHLIRTRSTDPANLTTLLDSIGPAFTYSDVRLSATDVVVGQPVTVEAYITNWGRVAGTKDVNVHVGGRLVASRPYLVPAHATIPIEVPFFFDAKGDRTVSINPTFEVQVRESTLRFSGLPDRLTTATGFSVQVLELNGSAATGVEVRAGAARRITDAEGRATFPAPAPGELQLLALRANRTEAAASVYVDDAAAPDVTNIVVRRFESVEPIAGTRENLTVEIAFENLGNSAGSATHTILVDGTPVVDVTLHASPGRTEVMRVELPPLSEGVHEVRLSGGKGAFTIRAYAGDDARIEALLLAYTDPASGPAPTTTQDAEAYIDRLIGEVRVAVTALAVASALLAGLGLLAVIHRQIAEREPRIGVLKALGATDEQVLAQGTREAAILGSVAVTVGVLAGCMLALALDLSRFVWTFGHAVHPSFAWYELALLFLFSVGLVVLAVRIFLAQSLQNPADELLRDRALRPMPGDPPRLEDVLEAPR